MSEQGKHFGLDYLLPPAIPTIGDAPNKLALVRRRLEWLKKYAEDVVDEWTKDDFGIQDTEYPTIPAAYIAEWVQERLDEIA